MRSSSNGGFGVNSLSLNFEWLTCGNDAPEIRQTMGMFGLKVGDISLTRHEDTGSQAIRDTVLLSAYPLAAWMVSSWWRLRYEPLPPAGIQPSISWRMAHELTAANQGFIWPRVILASDLESMQIWSTASSATDLQSIRYINSLEHSFSVSLLEFEQKAKDFIESVLSRLRATGMATTSLASLWQEVQEELAEPDARQYRRLEAELGFDPDECPETLVQDAINLTDRMGKAAFSEVAPVYSKDISSERLLSTQITELVQASGLLGKPTLSFENLAAEASVKTPWQKANDVALRLRHELDGQEKPVTDEQLYDLLGLQKTEYENFQPPHRQSVSIAVPSDKTGFRFYPRKKHPAAKRFELARFLGDHLLYGSFGAAWLTSTDLRTSRQQYQRAFAAEFLCPFSSLQAYLDHDYSESAMEDAAEYFQVSFQTVESILMNHGLRSFPQAASYREVSLPY